MRRLRNSIIGAAVLFFADALFLNQGLLSFFASFVCVVGFALLLLQTLVRLVRHKPAEWKLTAAKLGIVLLAASLAVAYITFSNIMAERRTLRVASACERYNGKYQHYPHNLSELVPEFLPSVPHAKYVLNPVWADLMYSEHGPVILYYAMPPFGRRIYHLDSKTWTYLD